MIDDKNAPTPDHPTARAALRFGALSAACWAAISVGLNSVVGRQPPLRDVAATAAERGSLFQQITRFIRAFRKELSFAAACGIIDASIYYTAQSLYGVGHRGDGEKTELPLRADEEMAQPSTVHAHKGTVAPPQGRMTSKPSTVVTDITRTTDRHVDRVVDEASPRGEAPVTR